jgi:tRNA (adenine57-N1/adenine58-N1)-methyltransferase
MGEEYLILDASIRDRVQHMRKGARPLYEYDAGIVAALLSLQRGYTVIEAGTGSACAALFFANIIQPGRLYTFEREKRFYDIARQNIKNSGLKNIVIKNEDVLSAKIRVKADAVFIDMQEPWHAIEKLNDNLKPGRFIVIFTPIIDDVKTVFEKLLNSGFVDVRAIQLDLKEIEVKKYARIKGLFGFPGFIIVGRKFR